MRQSNQRLFDETMCDASITNGDVMKPSKKMQNVCDGGTIKHGSDFSCVCDAGHTVDSAEPFAMRKNNKNVRPYQSVCDIWHTVHSDEPFVMIEVNTNDSA